jgi:hypothetical protein
MSLDNITITRTSEDGLTQVQWHFFRLNSDLLVNSYEELERPSLRHKFKLAREWTRLGGRRMGAIRKEDVPLPEGIKKEALEAFVAQMAAGLTVKFQA